MIRLWEINGSFQKIYEFMSPNDQALCVSSHPSKALFACGFESGSLRIFDIQETKVSELYKISKLPLMKVQYSSDSNLLITVAEDGFIGIHRVGKHDHQPIKQIPLDFSPDHVSISFNRSNSYFASIGNNGSEILIRDTTNFGLMNSVHTKGSIIKEILFSPNEKEIIAITTDCSMKFYDITVPGGNLLRKVTEAHRVGINSVSYSNNGQFLITGGMDNIVKVWDSNVNMEPGQTRASPLFFQSFIGHTFSVKNVLFNPNDNSQVVTVGGKEGIFFLWNFRGDVSMIQEAIEPEEAEVEEELKETLEKEEIMNKSPEAEEI